MFELNGTLILFVALFLLFMVLLNAIMLKPIAQVIDRRKARIHEDFESARLYAAEAETLVDNYQRHLHEVRVKAQTLIHETMVAAQSKRDGQTKKVQAEGTLKVEQMRTELSSQRQALLSLLVEPELELVREMTNKLLGDEQALSMDKENVRRALEEAR